MSWRKLTQDDLERMAAAGYHCEARTSDECVYRPAPHMTDDGLYACGPCMKLETGGRAFKEWEASLPAVDPELGSKYDFPVLTGPCEPKP